MDDLVDWLNKNSGAVQAIATVVLVTAFYVILTRSLSKSAAKQADASAKMAEEMREQAEASMRMAEEMQEQRLDAARPVLSTNHEIAGSVGQQPAARVKPSNMGAGPALNVQCAFSHPAFAYEEYWWPAIGAGQTPDYAAQLTRKASEDKGTCSQDGDKATISLKYEDLYGRLFETLVELEQNLLGWTELRTSVHLIGTAKNRVRPTEGWQELVVGKE